MKTFMILFPLGDDSLTEILSARINCDKIAGDVYVLPFKTEAEDVRRAILERHPISDDIEVLPINTFINMINDEDLNLENYFVSYVHVIFKV